MARINHVAIVGGTHGDEYSGIHLVEKWQKTPALIARDSFTCEALLANPKAHQANQRYIDADLNRQFLRADLADIHLGNYEQSRAKALANYLGPKDAPRCDVIIDLHNTTSNMGPTLVLLKSSPFTTQLGAYVSQIMPSATILFQDGDPSVEHCFLCDLATHGVIIEVGPQPQSLLRHDILAQMEALTLHVLDFTHFYNKNALPALPKSYDAFRYTQTLTLPTADGKLLGTVHPHVQDNDFKELKTGDPLFSLFDGCTVFWEGQSTYPHFINEAAYYDKQLAMSLADKIRVEVLVD
ncbi:MAG: aspartoacylase [Vibrionaceae bacterium]